MNSASCFSLGQDDVYPPLFQVTYRSRDKSTQGILHENPHRQLVGRIDNAFVVIHLLPLFIIALTYHLLPGERERGTFPLLCLQSHSIPGLLFRRIAVAGLLLAGALGVPWVLTLLWQGQANLLFSPQWIAWAGVAAAYGLFWLALSGIVNAFSRSSASSAITLASIWLLLTILLPSAINSLAQTRFPPPSRMEMVTALRDAEAATMHRQSQLLAAYFEDHPELAPPATESPLLPNPQIVAEAGYREQERILAPLRERNDRQLEQQQNLVAIFRFLSPALLAQSTFNDLSGTDLERHRSFLQQVNAYHDTLRAHIQPKVLAEEKISVFTDAPSFSFKEEDPHNGIKRAGLSIATLLLFSGIFLGTAWWRLQKTTPVF